MRPMPRVAISAYASYRALEHGRLFAQWLPHIGVVDHGVEFVDTELATYTNLSTIFHQSIGIELELPSRLNCKPLPMRWMIQL